MAFPFLIRRVEGGAASDGPQGFWIESTAPLEVDVPLVEQASATAESGPLRLTPNVGPDGVTITDDSRVLAMVEAIAQRLLAEPDGELLVAVHGYNNPIDVALGYMTNLFSGLLADPALRTRRGLVCLGYHWPSEKLMDPMRDKTPQGEAIGVLTKFARSGVRLLRGAPASLRGIAYGAGFGAAAGTIAAALAYSRHHYLRFGFSGLFTLLCVFLGAVPIALPAMRLTAYFRDQYRATQYGVPDLVRFFQLLDDALAKRAGESVKPSRIRVSFIGHSMGAFVVTSLVRILSDVFDSASVEPGNNERSSPEFGRCLRFGRLVLASPDIPAEALKTARSNFLASSLRRFDEAFLFSNAGDEVLHAVSTIANYFSFPSGGAGFGQRLGNVDVRIAEGGKQVFGCFDLDEQSLNRDVFVGDRTLRWFLGKDSEAGAERLARRFTYVDCTDFTENGTAYLSRALCKPALSFLDRLRLLVDYAQGKVDVHSGYFRDHAVRRLLLRFAVLGWDATQAQEESELGGDFNGACRRLQLQVVRGTPLRPGQ